MTSVASPSTNHTNRKKSVVTQGDFVRRIQPKRNVFKPTSYRFLVTLSSAREHGPSILLTPERRILSERGWTRQSTAPAAETTRRRTMRTS
jgi:hypothetical protein